MSVYMFVIGLVIIGVLWYFTRSESDDRPCSSKKSAWKPEREEIEPENIAHTTRDLERTASPIPLMVYNLVTETDDACEHVVWFSRCEGDTYEISINNVVVVNGSGADLDVAHLKKHSSLALMTKEKIAFPFTMSVNVLRQNKLYGRGSCEVRGPGEPLPE